MRIAVVATSLCLSIIGLANATDAQAIVRQSTEIHPQLLDSALRSFAKERGFHIVYLPRVVDSLRTQGASGELTRDEALTQILSGTGLVFRYLDAETVVIVPEGAPSAPHVTGQNLPSGAAADPAAPTSSLWSRIRLAQSGNAATSSTSIAPERETMDTVIVTGERLPDVYDGGQVARGARLGLLGNRDLMDTPFSTTAFTSMFMQDVLSRSLAQVISADPAVNYVHTSSQAFDYFTIRGFDIRPSDVSFEGLYGVGPPRQVATETVERVELIKGPTALLVGMSPNGAIGGAVNLAAKRAGVDPLLQLTGTYYSKSQFGAHVDAGMRFGVDQNLGARLNAVYRDGDGVLQDNSQKSVDVLLGLDYEKGGLRLTADLGYQRRNAYGVDSDMYQRDDSTVLPDLPATDARFIQPWTRQVGDAHYGVARVEYEFSPRAMAYVATGLSSNKSEDVLSYGFPVSRSGDFLERFWGQAYDNDVRSTEAGVRGIVTTGGVEHQLALAATSLSTTARTISFYDGTIDGSLLVPLAPNPSNIGSPNFIPAPALRGFPQPPKTGESTLSGISLADTLSFSEGRVLLTLGGRLQKVKTEGFNGVTGLRTSFYDEQAVSPAAALVVRPTSSTSIFANYMEGLTQGPTAPANSVNAGEVFEPYASEQIEVGVKWDRRSFGTTLSLFQMAQPSGLLDLDTLVYSLDGEQRNRGVEIGFFGEPLSGLRLLGGLMLLDAEWTKTQGGVNDGRRRDGISKTRATLGVDWNLPVLPALSLSARGTYVSSFEINTSTGAYLASVAEASDRTVFDLGARYSLSMAGKPVVLRLNVENIFNEAYWQSAYLYRGNPRTVLMSATVDL